MYRFILFAVVTFCLLFIAPAAAVAEDQFFDSEGVRIRYIDRGPRDGEPIVLIHGFTQSIETAWGETGVLDALDDDYRVIALDCRGHGKSDKLKPLIDLWWRVFEGGTIPDELPSPFAAAAVAPGR